MSDSKENLSLRLEGQVFVVETDVEGKETVTELPGELVLQVLIAALMQGIDYMMDHMTEMKEKLSNDPNNPEEIK